MGLVSDMWKHTKRSIEDVPTWIGFDKLLDYYNQSSTDEHKKIFCALFETGGRVSEVIQLKKEMFEWNAEALNILKMSVLKYRKHKTRDVLIPRDDLDPLVEDLISFVEDCKTEYLFPRRTPLTGALIPDKHASRTWMYLKVREISDDLWDHWFRAMRASYFVYVRKFDPFDLQEWFEWKSMDMAGHYVKVTQREIADKLGIKNIPGKQIILSRPAKEITSIPSPPKTKPEVEQKEEEDWRELMKEVM